MSMELALVRESGEVLCPRCTLADAPSSRFKGLMGRPSLAHDEGMLLATWSIHTSFMRFPIDVVFLDSNYSVVRVVPSLKPWRVAVERSAHAVVELPAGAAVDAGLEPGERLSLVAHPRGLESQNGGAKPPARIAIASSDSRFLRVAGFLLERHGFEVETFRQAIDVLPQVPGHFAVVVIDGSGSLSNAARVIRSLNAESPGTGVVVVGDAGDNGGARVRQPQSLRVLPKWDSFDRLVREIQLASVERSEYELA